MEVEDGVGNGIEVEVRGMGENKDGVRVEN